MSEPGIALEKNESVVMGEFMHGHPGYSLEGILPGIAIAPLDCRSNAFVSAFADCLRAVGFSVCHYGYQTDLPAGVTVMILHWPNDFFKVQEEPKTRELNGVLDMWLLAKKARSLKIVWVAHNIRPHDCTNINVNLTKRFLNVLDGVIYLSETSKDMVHNAYDLDVLYELITVHGHYRGNLAHPPQDFPSIDLGIRLENFGRIRFYKNLEVLVECTSALARASVAVSLGITGFRHDRDYAEQIERLAQGRSEIRLDFRSNFVADSELDAVIDQCHGVVLPYRDILNSGAVLLALSRNRPVLAPRLGSLPEIQANTGSEWLHLYDGPLTPAVVLRFVDHLRSHRPAICDLSAYDWGPIGRSLYDFINRICFGE